MALVEIDGLGNSTPRVGKQRSSFVDGEANNKRLMWRLSAILCSTVSNQNFDMEAKHDMMPVLGETSHRTRFPAVSPCHICRSVGVVGVGYVGKYAIHGVFHHVR